jgi:hypothetical protein
MGADSMIIGCLWALMATAGMARSWYAIYYGEADPSTLEGWAWFCVFLVSFALEIAAMGLLIQ